MSEVSMRGWVTKGIEFLKRPIKTEYQISI